MTVDEAKTVVLEHYPRAGVKSTRHWFAATCVRYTIESVQHGMPVKTDGYKWLAGEHKTVDNAWLEAAKRIRAEHKKRGKR